MNQWCTQDSDGCENSINKKQNILHLWDLREKLLLWVVREEQVVL